MSDAMSKKSQKSITMQITYQCPSRNSWDQSLVAKHDPCSSRAKLCQLNEAKSRLEIKEAYNMPSRERMLKNKQHCDIFLAAFRWDWSRESGRFRNPLVEYAYQRDSYVQEYLRLRDLAKCHCGASQAGYRIAPLDQEAAFLPSLPQRLAWPHSQ